MAFRIQIRRDTALNWGVNNPVLLQGEFGYETDAECLKIGDGVNPWNDLDYLVCGTVSAVNVFAGDWDNMIVAGVTGILFDGPGGTGSGSGGLATITITSAGTSGISGTSGTSGVSGTSGTSGVNGTSGTSGVTGDTGTSGTSGTSGATGEAGTSGTSGATGATGDTGTSGTSGTSGATGATGPAGTSGSVGATGDSGTSGTSGTSGAIGATGPAGTSGTSGEVLNTYDEGVIKTAGTTGMNFVGAGVTLTGSGNFGTITIPGTRVYAFKYNYGGQYATNSGTRTASDISTVTQIVTSPFISSTATPSVPSAATDNTIGFLFNNENKSFVSVYTLAYDAANDRYLWSNIDSFMRDLWSPDYDNIVTGLTHSSSGTAVSGNYYSDSNILTSFSSGTFKINLSQTNTGSSNLALPAGKFMFGHGYIFFVFPA